MVQFLEVGGFSGGVHGEVLGLSVKVTPTIKTANYFYKNYQKWSRNSGCWPEIGLAEEHFS